MKTICTKEVLTMPTVQKKFKTSKMYFPVEKYRFNVQVFTSSDGGNTFYYAGEGRFTRTKKEARKYIKKYKKRNKNNFIFVN